MSNMNPYNNSAATDPIEAARVADLPGAGLAVSYKRFSSKQQEGGDSIRRQGDQAAIWAGTHGFEILDVELSDRGKSAFTGKNVAEGGALHSFMGMLKEGRLPVGVTLIAENPDRISRQHHQDGTDILRDVVAAGANVALLSGVFLPAFKKFDAMDTIRLTLEFDRAHSESAYKSYRIGQAWNKNTEEVLEGTRLRSGVTPSWLRIEGEVKGGKFKLIPAKVKVVQEVFTRFSEGESATGIARDLDRRGVPPLRRGRWSDANVAQLLRTEAPHGTLEVGRQITEDERSGAKPLANGEYRKADRIITDVIKGYFPRVIDEETERKVKHRLRNREGAYKTTKGQVKAPRYQTKAMLTGVLKAADGSRLKRKAYPRTAAYINAITGEYIGAVPHIDQVLVDFWPEVRSAQLTETSADTEGLEAALDDAQDTLEFLKSKPNPKPRLMLAAEAEVEELKAEIKESRARTGLGVIDLPRDISKLEPHEVNALVRRVIKTVTIRKSEVMRYETVEVESKLGNTYERRKPVPVYDLHVTMKNGIKLMLGEGLSGFQR